MNLLMKFFALTCLSIMPGLAMATVNSEELLDLTKHWVGFFSIGVFILAYLLVMSEEYIHLRKSNCPQFCSFDLSIV